MRALYTLLLWVVLPIFFLRLLSKGRNDPDYLRHWHERLGFGRFTCQQSIWIHAVSLGESIAAKGLIEHLCQQYPQHAIAVTTMTPSGRKYLQQQFTDYAHVCYLPYDIPYLLHKLIRRIKPTLLIIMETELWPNLINQCQQYGAPIILANGRLSARSFARYCRIKHTTQRMIQQLTHIAAQAPSDANYFQQLGATPDQISINGSIKFDIDIKPALLKQAEKIKRPWAGRPCWIAASTHPGEEQAILDAHRQLLTHHPDAMLLLAPRHVDRSRELTVLISQNDFIFSIRSQAESVHEYTQVYLCDTHNELLALYATCPIAFVGGSLVKHGGHNILEPAAVGCACLSGPNTFNFKAITEAFINQQAISIVANAEQLANHLLTLFQQPDICQKQVAAAQAVIQQNRGALARLADRVADTMT